MFTECLDNCLRQISANTRFFSVLLFPVHCNALCTIQYTLIFPHTVYCKLCTIHCNNEGKYLAKGVGGREEEVEVDFMLMHSAVKIMGLSFLSAESKVVNGVAPLIPDPTLTILTTLSKKENIFTAPPRPNGGRWCFQP